MSQPRAYSDAFIQVLFGSSNSPEFLLSFLNSLQEAHGFPRLTSAEVFHPFHHRRGPSDKLSVLDVKAKDDSGRLYDVEVQIAAESSFPERSLYYWARLYSSQLKKGNKYNTLRPAISVNIMGFTLFPKLADAANCFVLAHKDKLGIGLTDHLAIHYLELPKLRPRSDLSSLERWMVFLKYEGTQEVDMEFLFKTDPVLAKAHEKFIGFTKEERIALEEISREKFMRDQENRLLNAEDRGREEGERSASLRAARAMKAEGLPVEQISRVTGLSEDEVLPL